MIMTFFYAKAFLISEVFHRKFATRRCFIVRDQLCLNIGALCMCVHTDRTHPLVPLKTINKFGWDD